MKVFKRACVAAAIAAGTVLVVAVAPSCRTNKAAAEAGPVATVNGVPIERERFMLELRNRRGRDILNQMITETLVRQRAQRLGISPTKQDIDRAYERAVAMAGSPADFERQLKRRAITEEQFRETLVPQVLLDKVIAKTVKVSRKEIRDYYDSHIAEFQLPERVRAGIIMLETRENAEQIRQVLDVEGADFAGLAKAFSIDPGTKDQGGDTGYFPREGYYAEEIASRAFAMRVGEISDVFEAPDGFCILRVIDRKPPETESLGEVRDKIRSRVAFSKREELRVSWLAEQRRKANIIISDPWLRQQTGHSHRPRAPRKPRQIR